MVIVMMMVSGDSDDDGDNGDDHDDHHGQLWWQFKVWTEAACVFNLHNGHQY